MSEVTWDGEKSEDDVQENIEQAVDAATDLEFATLEDVREAFRE